MVEVLKDRNEAIDLHINKCLSSSNVCGYELRESHYYLGRKLGKEVAKYRKLQSKRVAVLIMMRAGLPFGFGVVDAIDEDNDVTVMFSTTPDNNYNDYDVVIIADAVINTGKTIVQIANDLKNEQVIVVTNVISDKYLDNLKDYDIFATRISEHSFKGENVKVMSGGKGPDTGERLFNNSFFK